ncbi:MAG TPA: FAD-dependent oxidoreductase, partial [Streptosporangiaceae bacterium]
ADRLGIELVLGVPAAALDAGASRATLTDGRQIPYDELVIATGARPRPMPWDPHENLLELRTLSDARRLRTALRASRDVAVVGAGFIGAEVASAARSLGLGVTLIDSLPNPMSRLFGDQVGALFRDLHTSHQVRTHFGVGVTTIEPDGRGCRVTLSDGRMLSADLVVAGIGVLPDTAWLASSGLILDDGIVCDSQCRAVGHPRVHAAGDVARWHHPRHGELVRVEHWTNAADQARFVAQTIARPDASAEFSPVEYVWSDQYDWKIQITGCPWRGAGQATVTDPGQGRFCVLWAGAGQNLSGALAVNWPKASLLTRRAVAAGQPIGSVRAALLAAGGSAVPAAGQLAPATVMDKG